MSSQTASEQIAEFVTGFDLTTRSADRVHTVARALVDTVSVAVAGQHEPASKLILEYARQSAGGPSGTVWATGKKLPIESAALVNGVMGHVLDYDDLTSPLRAHLSVALLPLLVGLAEAENLTGRAVSAAYVVGFEVACRLSRPWVSEHYARGWHSTSSVGVIGATAAGAHLLGYTTEQTVNALGLAVAQASGTRQNFGTMAKSFQAGHCGAVAARALALARLGFTASPAALDGDSGYLALYTSAGDMQESLGALGSEPLEIDVAGADIKKYPLCYATHRVLDGLLDLRGEHEFGLADVDAVEIETNFRGLNPLLHDRPQTGLEAKFSMEYAVAAALADGRVVLRSFEDDAVQRPEIQAFFPRVRAVEGSGPPFPRWAAIAVRLKDGSVLDKRVHDLRGSVDLPLSDDQLRAKADDCFRFAGLDAVADPFVDAAFDWADRSVASVLPIFQPQSGEKQELPV